MLKRAAIGIVLFLMALALIDRASLVIAPCSQYYAEHNQKSANDDKCAAREGVVIAGIEWLANLAPETWTALATIAIAAFTGTLWWSTNGMLQATNESLRLARDEFLSSHRPHMRLKHIWLESDIWNGEPIEARLDVANFGTGSGLITRFNYLTELIESGHRLPQRPPYNETDKFDRPVNYQFAGGGEPLGSGITFTRSVCDGRVLSTTEIQDIRNGRLRLYFIGTIEYWTLIGGARGTAFCRYLSGNPSSPSDIERFQSDPDPDYEFQD